MKGKWFFILAPLALCSCSIKENRVNCPSEVTLCFKALNELTGHTLDFSVWDYEPCERLYSDDFIYQGGYHTRKVYIPRRKEMLLASYGIPLNGEVYTIEKGRQCDSVYTGYKHVEMAGEYARDTIVLHKHFSTVTVNLHAGAPEDINPYSLVVRANGRGLLLSSDEVISGEYEYRPVSSYNPDGYSFVFRLPRLSDFDGKFTIDFCNSSTSELLYTMTFDRDIMEQANFSWKKSDLDDFNIDLDVGATMIYVRIGDWFHATPIDIHF